MTIAKLDAELSEIIGRIYDAVIDPGLWPEVCDRIRMRLAFHTAALTVHRFRPEGMIVNASIGFPADALAALTPQHSLELAAMWGGQERLQAASLEEPMVMSEVTDPSTWKQYEFADLFGVRLGLIDTVGMQLARDQSIIGAIGFGKHESSRPITRDDLDQLRLLAPHLRRAVQISGILDDSMHAAATFGAALDATAAAVVVVDRDGRILHANAVAQPMLAAGDPIEDNAGILQLHHELVPGQLVAATSGAGDEATLGRRGLGIPARRRDGSPVTATVMPLERRTLRGGVSSRAAAAVLIADRAPLQLPGDALSLLYDLSPAEVRVFELVIEGQSNSTMAAMLGLSANTVKTHIRRIFEKTGERTRVGLANLAHDIKLPG